MRVLRGVVYMTKSSGPRTEIFAFQFKKDSIREKLATCLPVQNRVHESLKYDYFCFRYIRPI